MAENGWSTVPGANLPLESDDPENDFAWLDGIDEDDCYMILDISRPFKSLDFGKDGCTASVSSWHELLQLTVPDDECGVVTIRGDFPDSAESILARAQRRNQKGTWGLGVRIGEDTEYVMEQTSAQGMINLRWPCTRFNLVQKSKLLGSVKFGSFTICSFIKDQTLYQVARIPPSNPPNSSPSVTNASGAGSLAAAVKLTIDVGGIIRLGCSNTNITRSGGPPISFCDNYTFVKPKNKKPAYVLAFTSQCHERRLEIRLWINREPIALERHDCKIARICRTDLDGPQEYSDEVIELHALHKVSMVEDKSITCVATFTLVKTDAPERLDPLAMISSTEVQDYLGVSDASISAPYRLWANALGQLPGPGAFELNTIGRAVEHIMGVSSVPVVQSPPPSCHKNSRSSFSSNSLESIQSEKDQDSKDLEANVSQSRTSGDITHVQSLTETCGCAEAERDFGVTLIKNIVSYQVVDLASVFWQTRLLIKALNFLDGCPNLPFQPEKSEIRTRHYVRMLSTYKHSILSRLRSIARWIFLLIPRINSRERRNPLLGILASDVIPPQMEHRKCTPETFNRLSWSMQQDRKHQDPKPRDQKWYCVLIIWFMLNQHSGIFHEDNGREQLWGSLPIFASFKNEDSDTGTTALDDCSMCFLRWYHSHSFVKICQSLKEQDPGRFLALDIDLAKHQRLASTWQIKAEKSLRLFGQGRLRYHSLNYEVASLCVLSDEIMIPNTPITRQKGSSITYAKALIKHRKDTNILSPGRSNIMRWDSEHTIRSVVPRPGPWELNCLGHHIPISLGITSHAEDCLTACKEYLLSDYTFMGTWDQSKANAIGEWWDIDPSSIICNTLLNRVLRKERSYSVSSNNEIDAEKKVAFEVLDVSTDSLAPSAADFAESIKRTQTPRSVQFADFEPERSKDDIRKILELLREKTKPDEESEGFVWRKRQPGKLYHADTTVQSLEDTPQVFKLKQTRNVHIRPNVQKHLDDNKVSHPDWSLETINAAISPIKLLHTSCFDLALQADGHETPEIGISAQKGRVDKNFWETDAISPVEKEMKQEIDKDPNLWILYFLGKPERHRNFAGFTKDLRSQLQDEDFRRVLLKKYQASLFSVLNDSMVDLGTKYRVLFVQSLSPTILQALIYMWHTDALDTFDDHLGVLSRFSNIHTQSSNGVGDVWITSITISHWRLQDDDENTIRVLETQLDEEEEGKEEKGSKVNLRGGKRREKGKDKKGVSAKELTVNTDFPPKSVSDKRSPADEGQRQLSTIRELSMSLVFTGDRLGRCWTCSIVSEVIDEEAVASYVVEIADILQMFIHQQYSGRTLCFLLLLGYLCESLSKECEKFTDELDKIMGMDPMVLLKGIEWHKSDVALKKLKKMLWGLEALRVFDDKLNRGIHAIKECKKSMDTELHRGAELRHRDMKRDADKILEEFEKRRIRLENAHMSILQRIEQSTRLREGITSVLSVEQNENIGMLTWVTIAYLPLAFIAGVFSMGHNIVPNDAGWGTFGWLIAVFLLVTVIFALSLQIIIGRLRRAGKVIDKLFVEPVKLFTDRQAHETSLAPMKVLRQAFGSRTREEEAVRVQDIETGMED